LFRPRRIFLTTALTVVVVASVAFMSRSIWLKAIGEVLVRDEAPVRADAMIVLAGDFRGDRVLKACELARQGYAPVIIVSGPTSFYGVNEADLAIRFATEHGCPAEVLKAFRFVAYSTSEEARKFQPELERREIHSVLVVTSNYHSARAGRTLERQFGNRIGVRMIAAPDKFFAADNWWKTREGQKTVFFEYSKTIASIVGL
jgi:uncharacterized SAM-binding protein YcdF (DUF218 family)